MGKRTTRLLGPVAASMLVIGASTGRAEAAALLESHQFSFQSIRGVPVTCTIEIESVHPRFGNANEALVRTQVVSQEAICQESFVSVTATYDDIQGQSRSTTSFGRAFVGAIYNDVGSHLVSHHVVRFENCEFGCNTEYTITQPK